MLQQNENIRFGEINMCKNKRFKQLKSILNFESEVEKEIRSDIDGRLLKNTTKVFEHRQ
jgi:hypothetical protein